MPTSFPDWSFLGHVLLGGAVASLAAVLAALPFVARPVLTARLAALAALPGGTLLVAGLGLWQWRHSARSSREVAYAWFVVLPLALLLVSHLPRPTWGLVLVLAGALSMAWLAARQAVPGEVQRFVLTSVVLFGALCGLALLFQASFGLLALRVSRLDDLRAAGMAAFVATLAIEFPFRWAQLVATTRLWSGAARDSSPLNVAPAP